MFQPAVRGHLSNQETMSHRTNKFSFFTIDTL